MTAIRDHQRAILAEKHVRAVSAEKADEAQKAYGAICMKLPILVHQAGLAPALHHVAQLSKKEKRDILDHLAEQLMEGGLLPEAKSRDDEREVLLRRAREADAPQVLAITREVQRCLHWYHGFVKTILKADPLEGE